MRTVNYILLSSLLCVFLGVLLVSAQGQQPPGTAWHSFVSDVDLTDPSPSAVTIWYFGGTTAFEKNDELWKVVASTDTWTKINPKSRKNPAGRHGHSATYDTVQDLHVIFGGAIDSKSGTMDDDTWFYNTATNRWSRSTGCPDGSGDGGGSTGGGDKRGGGKKGGGKGGGGSSGPLGRWFGAIAYNPITQSSMLFGGQNLDEGLHFADTWTLQIIDEKACWTKEQPTSAPDARMQAAMAYFPPNGTIVLHGGRGENSVNLCDMWEWDGTAWSEINQTGGPCIRDHSLLFDETLGQLCVFGGEFNPQNDLQSNGSVFCHDSVADTWSEKEPINTFGDPIRLRSGAPVASDNETANYVRFGGIGETGDFLSDTEIFTID